MKKLLLPIIAIALVVSSCADDLTSLNEDPKGASEVPGDPLFSHAQSSMGTLIAEPDYNINMFKYMAQYWSATTYADESQYIFSDRNIPSNLWSEIYRDVLNDLDRADSLLTEDELINEEQKQNQLAMIEVMKVLGYYKLVTTFGDVPYEESLNPDNASPAYTNQETIYYDLMDRLDAAIANLDPGAQGFIGGTDLYYNGDMESWVKFANSLKMRMAIVLSDTDPGAAQTAIEEASPNAFESNADNAVLPFTTTPPNTNPIWEWIIQSNRNDFVASNTMIDFMNDVDDPRLPIHFAQRGGEYIGGPYGTSNDYSNYSPMVGPVIDQDFEGMILGYDEVEFIRAEAAARGWNVGEDAETHYNNAVTADIEYWSNASDEEVSEGEIDGYLGGAVGFPSGGSEEDQLKAIAEQKWLALYPDGWQAWIDWRRLDHPTFNFADNPQANSEEDIPTRFTYPIDEQNLNQSNWEEAASSIGGDEKTTYLFWDEFPVTRW